MIDLRRKLRRKMRTGNKCRVMLKILLILESPKLQAQHDSVVMFIFMTYIVMNLSSPESYNFFYKLFRHHRNRKRKFLNGLTRSFIYFKYFLFKVICVRNLHLCTERSDERDITNEFRFLFLRCVRTEELQNFDFH